MKLTQTIIAALFALLLAACSTLSVPTTPNSQIKAAYDTVSAYVEMTTVALKRGRMTADQAYKASVNARKARDTIDTAATALAACKPPAPCLDYVSILQGLQPTLYEFERELRAQQGATR